MSPENEEYRIVWEDGDISTDFESLEEAEAMLEDWEPDCGRIEKRAIAGDWISVDYTRPKA